MRGKRILWFGLAGSAVACLLCVVIGSCVVVRSWQALSGSTVEIGRDTTYLDGPLDSQGFVDYVAALNQEMSAGIASEENAAVLLVQALGPPEGDGSYRREFYRLLGVEPLPLQGKYFVSGDSFVESLTNETDSASSESASADGGSESCDVREQFWKDHEEATSRPWTAREFPELACWVEMNEAPLKFVVQASKRPKCFLPIVLLTPEEGLISASSWLSLATRDVFRLISIRVTLRVGEGRFEDAWADLLAGHRLARHFSRSPMVIDGLVGLAMEGITIHSQTVLIHYGVPAPGQVRLMLEDLKDLQPPRTMNECLSYSDRLQTLDSIIVLSRHMPGVSEEIGILRDSETGQKLLRLASRAAIDWDEILRIANRHYDDLEEALTRPTFQERREAVAVLEASMESEREELRGIAGFLRSFVSFRSPKTTMSQHIGNILVALLFPASNAALESDVRALANRRMLIIALGAAAYRTEYGVYPESIDAVCEYLPVVPIDPYSEKPFHYRLEGDGFVVYSVGPNGVDEDGRYETGASSVQADDISLHVPPAGPDAAPSCYCQ